MYINTEPENFSLELIQKIEEKYKAKYICETSIMYNDRNWSENPSAIFYTETPHPEGSNYFAISVGSDGYYIISDALPSIKKMEPIAAVRSGDEVIYSRYRHDYRTTKDGKVSIDGGRDYVRVCGEEFNSCMLKFENDTLVII